MPRFEGHFKGFDGCDLFFQTWKPEKVRGVFVITHGLAEHSECYHQLAKTLMEDGWWVFGWDLRGHGRSEGKRGFVMNVSNYIDDLGCFLREVRRQSQAASGQTILFGHSMGGLITIRYLQGPKADYGALVLSSPALGLSIPVPKLKETVARVAIKVLPTLTLFNEIKYTDLTHDEEMLRSYDRDNLRHDKVSPGLFLSMMENFPLAAEHAAEITQPVLMQLAGEDKLVSTPQSREFFEHLPNKKNQLIVYPESYHEVYNDLDRDQVIADLKKFIHPFLGGQ
jgi:alpha-beta hydrolase superfamily lysophospholipase